MEEKTIHRLDKIRESNNLNNSELEDKLGMSNGSFAKNLKKGASVKDELIRKVMDAFPKTSLRWLVLGDGEMEALDQEDPISLVNYIVDNHEKLMESSRLYKEKMNNLAKDVFINEYGHLIKKPD